MSPSAIPSPSGRGLGRGLHFEILESLIDIIAPPRCMRCLAEDTYLCEACRLIISTPHPQRCIGCDTLRRRGHTCSSCVSHMKLAGVQSLGSYHAEWLRRGIHWLKFKSIKSVAPVLAELLALRLVDIAPLPYLQRYAVLVPIPLHPRRERQRGFNQSVELALALSMLTNVPVSPLIIRQRYTFAQAQMPAELRQQNLSNAFRQVEVVPPNKRLIIIIDDVATSGATLEAAAQAIKTSNTQQFWGLTLARG